MTSTDATPPVARRSASWFVFLIPAALTLSVCLFGLDARQPWRDEHSTWWAATIPLDALLRLLSNVDAVLAPYYFFMRAWIATFGDSVVALRLPSVLAMAAAAGVVGSIGARLYGAGAGFLAGCLFALVPAVSRYGQEARPYAFAVLFAAASTLALLAALAEPRSKRRWCVYAAALSAAGLAHLVAIFVWFAHAGAAFARSSAGGNTSVGWRRGWFAASAAAFAPLVPLVWIGSGQSEQIAWIRANWRSLAQLPQTLFLSPEAGGAVVGMALVALVAAPRARALLVGWTLAPPLFLFATFDQLQLFLPRYLTFTIPGWTLAAAWTIDSVATKGHRLGAAALLLAVVALGSAGQLDVRRRTPEYDHRRVAALLRSQARPGDAIAYAGVGAGPAYSRLALAYELRGAAAPRDAFVAVTALEKGSFFAEECTDLASCPLSDVSRLWLVTTAKRGTPFAGLPADRAALLRQRFRIADQRWFVGVGTLLLVASAPPRA